MKIELIKLKKTMRNEWRNMYLNQAQVSPAAFSLFTIDYSLLPIHFFGYTLITTHHDKELF